MISSLVPGRRVARVEHVGRDRPVVAVSAAEDLRGAGSFSGGHEVRQGHAFLGEEIWA